MDAPANRELVAPDNGADEETEEIHVDVTDDGHIWLHGDEWDLVLTAEEAQLLGQALLDAAADAGHGPE